MEMIFDHLITNMTEDAALIDWLQEPIPAFRRDSYSREIPS